MKNLRSFYIILYTAILALLSSCNHYYNNSLNVSLDKLNQPNQLENNNYKKDTQGNVTLYTKAFNNKESKEAFGVNLPDQGYIPLSIRIDNNTCDSLIIRPSYINVGLCSPLKIAKMLHYNTSLYSTSTAIPSFLFWWPALLVSGSIGYDMYSINKDIDKLLLNITLYKSVVEISPYEVIEKFMFIPKKLIKGQFNIKIFNKDKKEILIFKI